MPVKQDNIKRQIGTIGSFDQSYGMYGPKPYDLSYMSVILQRWREEQYSKTRKEVTKMSNDFGENK